MRIGAVLSAALMAVGLGVLPAPGAGADGAPVSEPPMQPAGGDGVGPTITVVYGLADGTTTSVIPASGWFRGPVWLSVRCDDPDGVRTCSPAWPTGVHFLVSGSLVAIATDEAGASSSLTIPVPIDQDGPRISAVNDRRTFTRDEVVTLGCTAVDDLSGVAAIDSPCPVGVPASDFAPGTYWYWIRAWDNAGNETVGLAGFTRAPQVVHVCDPAKRIKKGKRWVAVQGACRDVVK